MSSNPQFGVAKEFVSPLDRYGFILGDICIGSRILQNRRPELGRNSGEYKVVKWQVRVPLNLS
jgi:hypothetical protein